MKEKRECTWGRGEWDQRSAVQGGENEASSHPGYPAVPGATEHTTHYRLSAKAMRVPTPDHGPASSVNPWSLDHQAWREANPQGLRDWKQVRLALWAHSRHLSTTGGL